MKCESSSTKSCLENANLEWQENHHKEIFAVEELRHEREQILKTEGRNKLRVLRRQK